MKKEVLSDILVVIQVIALIPGIAGSVIGIDEPLGLIIFAISILVIVTAMIAGYSISEGGKRRFSLAWGLITVGTLIDGVLPLKYFYVGGVIFIAGMVVCFLPNNKKAIKKMNKTAIATLVDMRETGMGTGSRYHRNPEIELTYEFYTDRGMRVTAKEYRVMSYLNLTQLHLGAQVPIRYQEDKPENAAYDSEATANTGYGNYSGF